ncbi:MAG: M15 family metallopeptidase [Eubacteriaceae bacterium]|jgi:D-alanyl-D-alanine carboxypeptidase|nr:M15 family metallopeptidase [Eubacteriaceae bacterium]
MKGSREKKRNTVSRRRLVASVIIVTALIVMLFLLVFSMLMGSLETPPRKYAQRIENIGRLSTSERSFLTGEKENSTETADSEKSDSDKVDRSDPYLIIVNRTHELSKDYVPKGLQAVKRHADRTSDETAQLRKKAAEAFDDLTADAQKDGAEIVLTTGYRSYRTQKGLYCYYVSRYGKKKADRMSAAPGTSEHQTGLACDTSSPEVNYELTQKYAATKAGKWLQKNSYKYGFIIRFPQGKEDVTGYEYEPWHIRYVGKKAAKVIFDKKITLEEYLEED